MVEARRIMIEIGNHCESHILPRLKKVIEGKDENQVSLNNNWKGGGGFRHYDLADSLLKKDDFGQYIINRSFNDNIVKEAICMIMGYDYLGDKRKEYWQDGKSTEKDYIYILNSNISEKQLIKISNDIGSNSLLVCCKAFSGEINNFKNLTIKKIPDSIIHRYEWNKENYNLKII